MGAGAQVTDVERERESESIRARTLRSLLDATGADLAMCFALREWHGDVWVTGLLGEGDPWMFRHFERLDDQPIHRPEWLKPRMPGDDADRFVGLDTLRQGRPLDRDRSLDRAYLDADVSDQRRLLVYDGDRFIGWVGLLRCDGAVFNASECAALDAQVPRLRRRFTEALAVERDEERVLPTGVVLGPSGEVVQTTESAATVLRGGLRASLARATRRMIRQGDDRSDQVVRGIRAQLHRLRDQDEPRTLAWLSPLQTPTIDPLAALAPRIREAAQFLATGATAKETAAAMNVTEHTVRGYLKQAYRTLGVGSRVELAARLVRTDRGSTGH